MLEGGGDGLGEGDSLVGVLLGVCVGERGDLVGEARDLVGEMEDLVEAGELVEFRRD